MESVPHSCRSACRTGNRSGVPMIVTKASAVSGPTPGCVISRSTSGCFLASCSTAAVNSSMVGFIRSSSPNKSCRRRLAQVANGSFSSCARPGLLHSLFFRRLPSFIASACSWFMIRVRICTNRCRCHSSCRRSRFSGLGTQMRGKLFSSSSFNRSWASCRSVFCLRTRFVLIFGRIANPHLDTQCCQ